MVVTMIFSLGFAVGLFFLLPLFLSTFAEGATDSDLLANLRRGPASGSWCSSPTSG